MERIILLCQATDGELESLPPVDTVTEAMSPRINIDIKEVPPLPKEAKPYPFNLTTPAASYQGGDTSAGKAPTTSIPASKTCQDDNVLSEDEGDEGNCRVNVNDSDEQEVDLDKKVEGIDTQGKGIGKKVGGIDTQVDKGIEGEEKKKERSANSGSKNNKVDNGNSSKEPP